MIGDIIAIVLHLTAIQTTFFRRQLATVHRQTWELGELVDSQGRFLHKY